MNFVDELLESAHGETSRETTLPVIFAAAHLVGKEPPGVLPYEDEIRSVEGPR